MSNLSSLSYYIPELIIISAILLIIILDIIPSTKSYTFNLALASIIASAFFLCQNYGESHSLFMGMITLDPFSHYFKYIFLFATFSIILISRFDRQLDKKYASEYNCLLLIVLLGLFLMSSSVNLLMIYLSIELVSIPSYILAGMLKNDKESNEASLKYVIFGSLASGLMLFGLSILYGITGSTDISGISSALQIIEFPLTIYFPLILILAGFGYKISMVPFHFWTPDVYEGAPTAVTAFFAIVPKVSAVALIYRFCLEPFGDFYKEWSQIIIFLSIASMFLGSIAAIAQTSIKRLLAYSSIGHVGYILMGLASSNAAGIQGAVIYVLIYVLMNIAIFTIILSLKFKDNYVEKMSDLSGLSKDKPIFSICIAITMLSMAGIPPFAGFFGKFYIFIAALEAKLFYLAILGVLFSVVSAFYYLRIIKIMYFEDLKISNYQTNISSKASLILFFSILTITMFIFYPSLIINIGSHISIEFFNN